MLLLNTHTHLPPFPNSSFQWYNTLSKFWIPAVIFDRVKIWPMWLPTLKQCNKVLFLNPHRRGRTVSSPTESCSRPLITALYESLSHRSENVLPWLGMFFSLPHGCSSEWGNIYCSNDLYGFQAGNNQMISQPIYSLRPLANAYTVLFSCFNTNVSLKCIICITIWVKCWPVKFRWISVWIFRSHTISVIN